LLLISSLHEDDGKTTPSEKAQTVFGITELLESILLYVDFKTLPVASSRVSTEWRITIEKSNKLQKKLFLLPATFEEALLSTWSMQNRGL
jgi:hypothetical protein